MATTNKLKRQWIEDGSRLVQDWEVTWDNADLTDTLATGIINSSPLHYHHYTTTAQTAGTFDVAYSIALSTGVVTIVGRADTGASVAALVTRHIVTFPVLASQNGVTSGNMPG